MATPDKSTELFPGFQEEYNEIQGQRRQRRSSTTGSQEVPGRRVSNASEYRPRRTSITRTFLESNPPNGMWQATGEVASKAPTLGEIKSGSFSHAGWTEEGQRERRGTNPHEIHRTRRLRTASVSQRNNRLSLSSPTGPMGPHLEEEDERLAAQHAPPEEIPDMIRESDPVNTEERPDSKVAGDIKALDTSSNGESTTLEANRPVPDETGTYPNGYRFPPKHTWKEATVIGLKAFWKFILTPFGFVIFIYGLNVVAWGAMIFFVLLNAAPAMCHPSCGADNSPRNKWVEIDSQILNGLFCVTGLGLIPWRFRDLWWLLHYRIWGSTRALRFLAGIHRSWFRLPGSDLLDEHVGPPPVYTKKNPPTEASPPPFTEEEIAMLEANEALPLPATSTPPAPLTGCRAPPTKIWKLDFVVWMYVANTGFQIILCVCMWHWNRFNRPAWLEGIAISAGCVVAIAAGLMVFFEGKRIKKIEGIPVHEEEVMEELEKAEEGKHMKSFSSRIEKKKGRHWYERH